MSDRTTFNKNISLDIVDDVVQHFERESVPLGRIVEGDVGDILRCGDGGCQG